MYGRVLIKNGVLGLFCLIVTTLSISPVWAHGGIGIEVIGDSPDQLCGVCLPHLRAVGALRIAAQDACPLTKLVADCRRMQEKYYVR